jgi:hypothetical protein
MHHWTSSMPSMTADIRHADKRRLPREPRGRRLEQGQIDE